MTSNDVEMATYVEDSGAAGRGPLFEGTSGSKVKLGCCGFISLFIVVFVAVIINDSVHTIEEGTVGIYFVQGRLDDKVSHPGIHWAIPFVTEVKTVTIRPQTDTLNPITTVTKDGITNKFHGIQVLSDVSETKLVSLIRRFGISFRKPLIYDRIGEELRVICANQTVDEVYNTKFLQIAPVIIENVKKSISRLGDDGVKILNLVVPKPDIPSDISRNYQEVKVQWTKQLVATQEQKTERIKKETEQIKAVLDAERQKKVLEIDIQKDLLRKEGEKNVSSLNNLMLKESKQAEADVKNYAKTKEAEANQKLYTADYVKLEMAKELSKNTKFYFSGKESALGGLLSQIFKTTS